jgi:hypothetical protein
MNTTKSLTYHGGNSYKFLFHPLLVHFYPTQQPKFHGSILKSNTSMYIIFVTKIPTSLIQMCTPNMFQGFNL